VTIEGVKGGGKSRRKHQTAISKNVKTGENGRVGEDTRDKRGKKKSLLLAAHRKQGKIGKSCLMKDI